MDEEGNTLEGRAILAVAEAQEILSRAPYTFWIEMFWRDFTSPGCIGTHAFFEQGQEDVELAVQKAREIGLKEVIHVYEEARKALVEADRKVNSDFIGWEYLKLAIHYKKLREEYKKKLEVTPNGK